MTLPIERFKDSYQNWRYNPFTAADMAVDAEEDGLIIPSGSPFVIQLLEQPRYNDPTSVSVRCYGVDTTVDQDSSSGQMVLYVADTTGFSPGDNIIIHRGGAREEERIIDTVQAGVSLTVTVNLTYTHTGAQEDPVEKFIAFTETAGSPAQSQFRVDYPPGDGGEGTGLVEFNSVDANKEVRIIYKATGSPALAETLDTKLSYPAGIPADNQIVGFSSGAPYWLQLPHANLAGVSADQHHPQAHTLASHSSKAHSELTGIGANDHHSAAHTLASHSSKAHSELTGVSANQHHAQVHTHASHTGIGANDHHAQVHTLGSHSDFSTYLDQAVKQASSPTFAGLTLGSGVDGTLTGGSDLFLEAGNTVSSHTIYDLTSAVSSNMYIYYDGENSNWPILRATSAKKYKDNIKDLELDSSLIHNLRPVSFNSKCEHDDKNRRFIGLIADEIEKIYPEIIIYNEEKEAESYDSQMLMTLMLKEIQRLRAEI